MTEPFVFGTVMVGYDRSAAGRDALRLAELLASSAGARLLAVSVREPGDVEGGSDPEVVDEALRLLGSSRVPAEARVVRSPSPARVLHELAVADNRVGLLVLGSTHRRVIAGTSPRSVVAKLLGGAPCPVAIAPPGYAPAGGAADSTGGPEAKPLAPAEAIRVIAVGFDDSPEARSALELAAAVGLRCRATLRVIAADHPGPQTAGAAMAGVTSPAPGQAFELQARLHAVVSELPSELRALPVFDRAAPAKLLVGRAEVGVDLLVMGSRGYGPAHSVLVGAVSGEVIQHAGCPVLIAPRAASA